MFLNSGTKIAKQIKFLIDSEIAEPARLAVAFWGKDANYKLRGGSRIICNLESGLCHPQTIRTLLHDCEVRKLSKLHAKVVISSAGAIVSSANMSTNGLGPKGGGKSGNLEAGYFVPAKLPDYWNIAKWFDDVWKEASEINEDDLNKAKEKWDLRHRDMTVTPSAAQGLDTSQLGIDLSELLNERIEAKNRLRAVKPDVFNHLEGALPDVDPHRLGKIASWACHLLLNRTGQVLDHSAGKVDEEGVGLATDSWIVSKFGTRKRDETAANVKTLLVEISQDPFFLPDVRRAANQVLSAPPWIDHNLSGEEQ